MIKIVIGVVLIVSFICVALALYCRTLVYSEKQLPMCVSLDGKLVPITIYYVNLKRREDRRKWMESQLSEIKHQRVPAVKGLKVSLDEVVENNIITSQAANDILKPTSEKVFGITLTYGALGAAMSHMNIWNKATENRGLTLILEDDALIEDLVQFSQLPQKIENIPNDWDIFYLGSGAYVKSPPQDEHDEKAESCGIHRVQHAYGLFGYVINSNSAKKLSSVIPLHSQVDGQIQELQLKKYILEPNLVIPRRDMISDIQIVD